MKSDFLKEDSGEKRKKIFGICIFAVFLIFCGAVTWFVGRPMIRFAGEPARFREWVLSHGIWGEAAFVGMVILQVVVALIPGEPLEIGAGYAFGALKGTALTVIGVTIGSLLVFLLVRTFGVKFVELFFDREKLKKLKFLKTDKQRNILIFILFFFPGTPKDLITYFVGLTDIKLWQFFLFASLGRLPSIITSTLTGDALGVEKYKGAVNFLLIAVAVSLIGVAVYKIITNRKNRGE